MSKPPTPLARANRIAVLLPSLEGGGAEWSMLNLVKGFLAQGREVDLLLCQAKGAYIDCIPEGARVVELEARPGLVARLEAPLANPKYTAALLRPVVLAKKNPPEIARLASLMKYIKSGRADVIVSALTYANLLALWARDACNSALPVLVSERIALTTYCASPTNFRKWRMRYLPELVRKTYPRADAIVTVSDFVADELSATMGLSRETITTIYNPIVDADLRESAGEALDHDWFNPGSPPVILGVGRLTEQKDFATLLRAFARVRKDQLVRLVILGRGRLRGDLEALARELGVEEDIDMPGFVDNPLKYMSRASVLVSSSEYEGLPGVLIQSLAAGCPVVSTDCPGGSSEILANGEFGPLVGVGDDEAMAEAISQELNAPRNRDDLLSRAEEFSVERGVEKYLSLIDTIYAAQPGFSWPR